MTPESQRIAIAEACGWVRPIGITNVEPDTWWTKGDNKLTLHLPDYLNDLNAMHEAEKVLDDEQAATYYDLLNIKLPTTRCSIDEYVIHATAAQRAEAFLRTLNLWTE
jgi:hypothetical protein